MLWLSQEWQWVSQEELCDTIKGWCPHSSTVVTQEGQRATIGVTSGDEESLLSAVRPYGMGVLSSEALDMNGSLHLTIGYLLRFECRDLESQAD